MFSVKHKMVATEGNSDLQFELELDITLGEPEPELEELIQHEKIIHLHTNEEREIQSSPIFSLSSQEDIKMNTSTSSQEEDITNSPSIQRNNKTNTRIRQECIDDMNDIDRRSVFVRNVDHCTTVEELEHHFLGDIRPINRVTILCNKYDGLPKGCAYVEFAHQECVQAALELDDSLLKGRHIKVMPKRSTKPGQTCGGHAFIGRLGQGDYIVEFHEEANWIKFLTKSTRSPWL